MQQEAPITAYEVVKITTGRREANETISNINNELKKQACNGSIFAYIRVPEDQQLNIINLYTIQGFLVEKVVDELACLKFSWE